MIEMNDSSSEMNEEQKKDKIAEVLADEDVPADVKEFFQAIQDLDEIKERKKSIESLYDDDDSEDEDFGNVGASYTNNYETPVISNNSTPIEENANIAVDDLDSIF